jgi:hypothetical protein
MDALMEYLDEFALDLLFDERLNCLAYHATGGTADQREERGETCQGILDGWGVYSQRPAAFIAAVKKETLPAHGDWRAPDGVSADQRLVGRVPVAKVLSGSDIAAK